MVDSAGNSYSDTVEVFVNNHPTDLNKDRKVDILDIVRAAAIYGFTSDNPRWDVLADVNRNGRIDICDLVIIAADFGETY